jgi:hypothetical protein
MKETTSKYGKRFDEEFQRWTSSEDDAGRLAAY